MKLPKVFAVVPITAVILLAGLAPGIGRNVQADAKGGDGFVSPGVAVEAQGESSPAQSLDELLGFPVAKPGAKGSAPVSAWVLSEDTVAYSNLYVNSNEKLYLGGHTLTIYGELTIYGALDIDGGKLILKKSPTDTKNITGNLIIKGGQLVMQKTADSVEIEKSVIADGGNETGNLTAGTLKVSGHFLQLSDTSPYSYNETGTHTTIFSGANKLVVFTSPLYSGIQNLSVLAGTSFTSASIDVPVIITKPGSKQTYTYHTTGGTFLSLKKNLTANYSIAVPNLYYMGTQGAWSLGVSGNLIVPMGSTQNVTGNISAKNMYVFGTLNMAAAGKAIAAANSFSVSGALNLSAGAITTKNFSAAPGSISAVGEAASSITVSRFTSADISAGGSSSPMDISGDIGARNLALAGPAAIPTGAVLKVGGSLTVLPVQTLSVGAGQLFVSGDMDVKGLLDMQNANGLAVAGGAFKAEGSDSSGCLTNGTLILEGSFQQAGNANSFRPGPNHTTMFFGQSVGFANPATPGSTSGSWFGSFIDCNPDAVTNTYFAISGTPSSTKLEGITASSNGEIPTVYPAFSRDTLNYELAVPVGAGSVSLSCVPSFPNQTVDAKVDGSTLLGNSGTYIIPINDPTKTTTVTLQVLSSVKLPFDGAGAPFYTTYSILLQPQNANLLSPGMPYSMDKPFDANTLDYAVTVPARNDTVSFTPVLAAPSATIRYTCGGVQSTGPTFTKAIAPGDESDIEVDVEVSAYTNPNVAIPVIKTYKFTFHRLSLLDGIDVVSGADHFNLSPAFDRSTNAYTIDVPASVYAVSITPQKGDGCSYCKVNNNPNTATLNPPIGGSATATIEVADSGSYSKTYTVTVNREALLKGISVSADKGSGITTTALPFSSNTTAYVIDVPVGSTSISVSAEKRTDAYSLVIDGNNPVINPGDQADVKLTASAGADPNQQVVYTVRIRMPLVSALALPAGAVATIPFSPDNSVISAFTIPYTWPSVVLQPQGNSASSGQINFLYYYGADTTGTPLPDGTISLSQGQTRLISIAANYNGTPETYKVNITRALSSNPNLKAIGASTGLLSPVFSASTTAYTLTIPETVSTVTLTPVPQESNSSYKIDSLANNTPRIITLSLNSSVKATVVVTAAHGEKKTYTVTVHRLAMLTGFSAKPVYAGYSSLCPGGTNRMAISYSLSQSATVKIEVKKGTKWFSVFSRAESSPGAKSFSWDGKVGGVALAAGAYSLRITPYCAGKAGTAKTLTVKILPKPVVTVTSLSPSTFTANGSNNLKAVVKWTQLTDARVDVVNSAGAVVKTLYLATNVAPASKTLYWDGKNSAGALVPAGKYRIKVICGGAAVVYKVFTLKR